MNALSSRRYQWLQWVLRLSGISFLVFFGGAIVLNFLNMTPVFMQSEAGQLFLRMLRWGGIEGTAGGIAYEYMIATIYVVWGIFLIMAAQAPLKHKLFIDFSVLGNVAHFGLMLLMGLIMENEHTHLYGDVLLGWLMLITLIAVWWPVRRFAA